jgi:hypothetical protein
VYVGQTLSLDLAHVDIIKNQTKKLRRLHIMGEARANIYEKLHVIQQELKAEKGQTNDFGGYKYRSCEDILEAVKPLLKQTKTLLLMSDKVLLIGDRYYVEATAKLQDTETDAYYETSASAREEFEKKKTDCSQLTGAASSYARKYALNGLLCIDDNKDADATNKHGKDEKPKTGKDTNVTTKTLSDAQVKRLYTIAGKKNITNEQVKTVIKTEYKKDSANDLSKKEYDELVKRLEAK